MKRISLLLPLWLVFALGEPSLVHPCPTHGPAAAQQQNAVDPHAAHASDQQPSQHSHGGCSCIGNCTAPTGAVVPRVAPVPATAIVFGTPSAPALRHQLARAEAHHSLPFANGPPAHRG